jgi:[histone H3]-dimethyl-L-lysine9 demethylase
MSGFCKPSDADADDIELWLPVAVSDRRFTVEKAKYTIAILSDSFVRLLEEEKEAADLGKEHGTSQRMLCPDSV